MYLMHNEIPNDLFYIPSTPSIPDLPSSLKSVPIYENLPVIVEIKPQTDTDMYTDDMAFEEGTLFPCLKKPFKGGRA